MVSTDYVDGSSSVLRPDAEPVANDEAVVSGSDYRITVLTPRVFRLQYAPEGEFEDRATQRFWYRDQPVPEYEAVESDDPLTLETEALRLRYDTTADGFAPSSLSVELRDATWRYGDDPDGLGGALRTVDTVDGATALDRGLLTRDGWTVVDDTDSLAFGEDGWVKSRDTAPA